MTSRQLLILNICLNAAALLAGFARTFWEWEKRHRRKVKRRKRERKAKLRLQAVREAQEETG